MGWEPGKPFWDDPDTALWYAMLTLGSLGWFVALCIAGFYL